jgi:hypothetical protein
MKKQHYKKLETVKISRKHGSRFKFSLTTLLKSEYFSKTHIYFLKEETSAHFSMIKTPFHFFLRGDGPLRRLCFCLTLREDPPYGAATTSLKIFFRFYFLK